MTEVSYIKLMREKRKLYKIFVQWNLTITRTIGAMKVTFVMQGKLVIFRTNRYCTCMSEESSIAYWQQVYCTCMLLQSSTHGSWI